MKKPLMSVPPAQAEALYDAALLNTPRGRSAAAPAVIDPPCRQWDVPEWGEDDSTPDGPLFAWQGRPHVRPSFQ